MYEKYFDLQILPFGLTPNTHFFCDLPAHQDAYNTILFCLHNGEGFIKVVGEVGTGKTLLCRKLLNTLSNDYITAYIPNPALAPYELQMAIAQELNIEYSAHTHPHALIQSIQTKLIELNRAQKHVVLIVDEAQALADESLEMIRLLTNLETEQTKLMQVVLFGQPELDSKLNQANLRQLKQRITFTCYLPTINLAEMTTYLNHRLAQAGCKDEALFSKRALKLLNHASKGIPRLINILAHKSMLVAYGRGERKVTAKALKLAIHNTEAIKANKPFRETLEAKLCAVLAGLSLILACLILWVMKR